MPSPSNIVPVGTVLPGNGIAPFATFTADRIVKTAQPSPGQTLHDIISLSVTQGSYGVIGSAEVTTSIASSGIANGLSSAARRGKVDAVLWGAKDTGAQQSTDRKSTDFSQLFTGVYDSGDFDLEADTLDMHFRDLGAFLQERTVQPRIPPPNTTIVQYVQELADDAGIIVGYLNSDDLSTANGQPLKLGSFFANQHAFTKSKQTAWGVLHNLAKITGNVVYFTNAGLLYFGPRSTGDSLLTERKTLTFSQSGTGDLLKLTVTHQPSRHSAFINQVSSHDRSHGISTRYTTAFLNDDLARDAGLQGGIFQGLTVPQLQESLNQGEGSDGLPVYDIYVEGKQQDECYAQALSQTRETQGQEIVVKGTVLGTRGLAVGDPLTFEGTGLALVDGQPFTLTSQTYSFDLERGYLCSFTAWAEDAPVVGTEEGV